MNTYVASIGGKSVLAFRAENDDQARAIIDDPEGSMRSDLQVLVGTDGKPLWDGKSAIQVREANAAQHAEWEQSRDQAIIDGEIDLDAGNDPEFPERKKFSVTSTRLGETAAKRLVSYPTHVLVWERLQSAANTRRVRR